MSIVMTPINVSLQTRTTYIYYVLLNKMNVHIRTSDNDHYTCMCACMRACVRDNTLQLSSVRFDLINIVNRV